MILTDTALSFAAHEPARARRNPKGAGGSAARHTALVFAPKESHNAHRHVRYDDAGRKRRLRQQTMRGEKTL